MIEWVCFDFQECTKGILILYRELKRNANRIYWILYFIQQQKQPSLILQYATWVKQLYIWSKLFVCLMSSYLITLRYWKKSLLVHPDKCSHPQAHQAFIKLNKAFKELQDPEKVSLLGVWYYGLLLKLKPLFVGYFSMLASLYFCDIRLINCFICIFLLFSSFGFLFLYSKCFWCWGAARACELSDDIWYFYMQS